MALMENSLCKYFYSSGCDFNNFLRLFPAPCKMFQFFVQKFSSLVHVLFLFSRSGVILLNPHLHK